MLSALWTFATGFENIDVAPYWQIAHQRIRANATKPSAYSPAVPADDKLQDAVSKAEASSVHPDALSAARRFLHDYPLCGTDYNWVRREAEYQNYKKWHRELEDRIGGLWRKIHEKGMLIHQLAVEVDRLGKANAEQEKLIAELRSKLHREKSPT